MYISKKALALIGVFVIVIAAVGIGYAQGDEITACVKQNGQVEFLTESKPACESNETPVTWNIQGPQGPQGEPGPQGPEGPPGPSVFPSPEYDSGWVYLDIGITSWQLTLNYPLFDYFIDMQCSGDGTSEINNHGIGVDNSIGYAAGVYYQFSSDGTLTLRRFWDDVYCPYVRIRMWAVQ